MSRIAKAFKPKGKKALIPYLTVGYPDISKTEEAALLLEENGADIIELGIPFSDPLADGVTIQNASFYALQNGVTIDSCLTLVAKLRSRIDTPLVFMSYLNPIYRYGIDRFCADCSQAGVDGLIIPDLPPEEGKELEKSAIKNGIDLIYLLAPTSTSERIRHVASHSHGFIYLVSEAGVTGTRTGLPKGLEKFVGAIRKHTYKPLCVGFGISTPQQAQIAANTADGVIIGSKILNTIEDDQSMQQTKEFIREVRNAMDRTKS